MSVGLFDYPVLMAADILLYDTDEVPVGDDQRQHVELTRDIAIRFNHTFGDTFVVPKATFPAVGARIMDLQHADEEDVEVGGVAAGHDPRSRSRRRRSRRRSSPRSPTPETEVRHDREQKPGVSNLIEIYGAVTGASIAAVEKEFDGQQYGAFKSRRRRRGRRVPAARCRSATRRSTPIPPKSTAVSPSAPTSPRPRPKRVLGRAMKAAGLLPRPRVD